MAEQELPESLRIKVTPVTSLMTVKAREDRVSHLLLTCRIIASKPWYPRSLAVHKPERNIFTYSGKRADKVPGPEGVSGTCL